jgi:6-phosphofructokinase 1
LSERPVLINKGVFKNMNGHSVKRVAVLTSGGDAPGMNAAIRAVVRSAVAKGWEAYGVKNGYAGLLAGKLMPMGRREVGGIIQQGGTVLGSARCPEFYVEASRNNVYKVFEQFGLDGLVVIGGNGSQTGACRLHEMGLPVVGIASTIDNDLYGSEVTIGVDTALNVALEAIDRLKVTASSHNRAFLLEVMGRNCGYLALMAAIAGGAEALVIPEIETDPENLAVELLDAYERGKAHAIVVVAEGAKYNAQKLIEYFDLHQERLGFELRAITLGHVQRGGEPDAFDRLLGSRLGAAAVACFERGETGVLTGLNHGEITTTPLPVVIASKKELSPELLELANVLSR